MKTRWTFGALLVAALLALPAVFAQEDKKETEEKEKPKINWAEITCPVSGSKVNKEAFVEFKEAKVYFCCENCPKAFAKDPKSEKFAAKVNYQFVATKQAKQQACPLSGSEKLNKETTVEVGAAKVPVAFCCENCQKKVTDAQKVETKEAQEKLIAMLFNEEKFVKAYKIGDDEEEDADEEGDEDEDDEEDDDEAAAK